MLHPSPPRDAAIASSKQDDPERYRAGRRVTLTGLLVNVCLAVGQIVVGTIGTSQALVADGIHTVTDVATDLMVLLVLRQGSRSADAEHPYGHSRIETAATVGLGVVLIAVALGISINAALKLMSPETLATPAWYTLAAVVVTIVAKEGLYRYAMRVARRHRSSLVRANAWHYRSDALDSAVVFLGISGALIGYTFLDAVAAIGVGVLIAKVGWDLAYEALQELIDTGLDQETVDQVREEVLAVDGVHDLHLLRTRRMGGQALVDMHILVSGGISVSEGHHISETVGERLIERFREIDDVTVHIDPEDDEEEPSSLGLPLRDELTERLRSAFASIEAARHIERITLHYLAGQVGVELVLPLDLVAQRQPDADAQATHRGLVARFDRALRENDPALHEIVEALEVLYR